MTTTATARRTRYRAPRVPVHASRGHAIGYVRVSTEEQSREGVSLEAQEARIRSYCAMRGLELVRIVRDEGVSAGRPLSGRPGGADVLSALADGSAEHVVAMKLDRLFRNAIDCLQTASAWESSDVALHLIDLGGQAVDTTSAMGRFFLTVMAGAAEMERNLVRERTRTALAHKRSKGEHIGPVPLGYRVTEPGGELEHDADELEAVRLIIRRRYGRASFRAIAAELTERGFRTKRGGEWGPSTERGVWMRRRKYGD